MKRRAFITLLGDATAVTLVSWPLAARAQQGAMPVVGFLNAGSAQIYAPMSEAFLKGLGEAGYVDGRNVTIEYRWADGQNDRLPALAAELVQREVAVLAATSTPAALAAKAATTTVPIVFETAADPVQLGLVASLNRPGGNLTGVTQTNLELGPKRLEVLHELLPAARVMAVLVDPSGSAVAEITTNQMQAAARTLGLELKVLNASGESDFDAVFAKARELRVSGLVIGAGTSLFASRGGQLAAMAARHAVPSIGANRAYIQGGGLISYGADIVDTYRLTGNYVGRVLKGEKPADLPVQQATKIQLLVNLKAAKALGINVPLTLLGRADEVIE
jgi:putative tryptophan/tyrosine transport system substrate-binding protein